MLSYSFPMILYFLRYSWFVINMSEIKAVFQSIGNDCRTFRHPLEYEMFMKHIAETRRVIMAYIVLAALLGAYIIVAILVPTILHSKLQLRYLRMFGFFYNEGSPATDWAGVQLVIVSVLGQMALVGTEASVAVFSAYLCGLFEITSFRIHTAVNDVAHSISSEQIDIKPAARTHRQAVELAAQLGKCMTYSYLMAIVAVVLSFAVNLYRLLLAARNTDDLENLFFSFCITLSHILIMFLDNHSGQKLVSTSVEVFHETYNSLWYCLPARSQKLLLFIMMRSMVEVQYNFSGLFVPCYEGFSMLMSSSFSYFTMLISVQ
ncbi:uncharacterized protein LOC143216830 isoform X1 [Lasioglossum baleicum]|uniref:uncharacterized protein LOC143216830 isoform X1 n=2 Tax=Lasioglossum baleicum TaxID=434251 RepID=UPI003FCE8276